MVFSGTMTTGRVPLSLEAVYGGRRDPAIDNRAYWLGKNGGRIKVGGVGDYLEDILDIEPTIADVNNDFVVLVTTIPIMWRRWGPIRLIWFWPGMPGGGSLSLAYGLPSFPPSMGEYPHGSEWRWTGQSHCIKRVGTITPPVRVLPGRGLCIDLQNRNKYNKITVISIITSSPSSGFTTFTTPPEMFRSTKSHLDLCDRPALPMTIAPLLILIRPGFRSFRASCRLSQGYA